MARTPDDRSVALPRVAAALCAIAVLALVLPYAAVQAFHQRRLDTASRHLETMAASLGEVLAAPTAIPPGTQLLAGTGPRPVVDDDLWTTAAALPLTRVMSDPGPDPWGNAYLVNIRDRSNAWVISAGPDGIVQTPFAGVLPPPLGDDRVAAIR